MTEKELPKEEAARRQLLRTVFLTLLGFGLAISFNLWYTNSEVRQSDQYWCTLVGGLDDRYEASVPPGSEEFAQQIKDLRADLRCSRPGLSSR